MGKQRRSGKVHVLPFLPGSVERGTVRVKCIAKEHNTINVSARARIRTARSGVEWANHEHHEDTTNTVIIAFFL